MKVPSNRILCVLVVILAVLNLRPFLSENQCSSAPPRVDGHGPGLSEKCTSYKHPPGSSWTYSLKNISLSSSDWGLKSTLACEETDSSNYHAGNPKIHNTTWDSTYTFPICRMRNVCFYKSKWWTLSQLPKNIHPVPGILMHRSPRFWNREFPCTWMQFEYLQKPKEVKNLLLYPHPVRIPLIQGVYS